MAPRPVTPQAALAPEPCTFGDFAQAEAGLGKQLTGKLQTCPHEVLTECDAGRFSEHAPQLTLAETDLGSQRDDRPVATEIAHDPILHPMNTRGDVVPVFEPEASLAVLAATAVIQHRLASDARGDVMTGGARDQVQRKVESRGDAGAGDAVTVLDEQAILDDVGAWRNASENRG